MKKNILIVIGLVVIATFFISIQNQAGSHQVLLEAVSTSSPRTQVSSESFSTSTILISQATIKIDGNEYVIEVLPDETLLQAMTLLALESDFTFTSRSYPGLGAFIDSIGGKQGASGNYWLLYVNGVVASTGVSATKVHEGDKFEWKYEKSY